MVNPATVLVSMITNRMPNYTLDKIWAKNLEFKAQCQSLDDFYPRLADLKATHSETVRQVDTYFYIPAEKSSALSRNV